MASYTAEDIEVLTGLDPVKTPRHVHRHHPPQSLGAGSNRQLGGRSLAGHAKTIDVILHKDGSVSVTDDGRGMPVDVTREQGKPWG